METKAEFSKMLQDGRHPGRLGTTHRFLIAFIAPFLLSAFFYVMSISPSASRELAVTAFFCGGFSVAALLSVAVAFLVGWSTPRDLAVFLFSAALLVLRTDPVFSNFVEARAPGLAWVWLPVVSAVFFWSHMRLVRFLLRLSPGSRLDRVIFWGFIVPNFALLVPLFALPAAWDFFYFAKCFHATAWGVLSLVLMLHCAYATGGAANKMVAAASLPFSIALCVNLLIISGAMEPVQLRFFELCILWMMLVLSALIIRAQVAMSRETRARELMSDRALGSINEGIALVDNDMNIVWQNEVMERISGVSNAEVVGGPLRDCLKLTTDPAMVDVAVAAVKSVVGGSPTSFPPYRFVHRRTGRTIRARMRAAPVYDSPEAKARRESSGVIVVIDDVTDLLDTRDLLDQAQRIDTIGRLASGIAHDFTNSLGGIRGLCEVLERKLGAPAPDLAKARELASDIAISVDDASSLSRKLLDFAHGRGGEREPVRLDELVDQVLYLSRLASHSGIRLERDIAARRCTVLGDRSMLQNVVLNLIINACEAMPEGGRLSLGLHNVQLGPTNARIDGRPLEPGDYLEFTVADTGVGIRKEQIGRVFEAAFSTKRNGNGFGLAMAKRTVIDHGGDIYVVSKEGEGSVFTLLLPVHEGPAAPAGGDIPAQSRTGI